MKSAFWRLLLIVLLILGAIFIGSKYYYYSPFYHKITAATAVIHPVRSHNTYGIVNFTQEKDGVLVTANISGLTPGEHGFHIHEYGDCGCDDAKCAGEHFNPTNQSHGSSTAEKRHVGDLGNLTANMYGYASYSYLDKHLELNGPNSIIGRSVIVHQNKDDYVSQPSGNSGERIGCGNIGIKEPK